MDTGHICISISQQMLIYRDASHVLQWPVSTAVNGVGQQEGSGCTPLGQHIVRAKIGSNAAQGSVFVGRRYTGEVYSAGLAQQFPNRDWILTRILWLSGTQKGYNRGANVDSQRRYIYIHGTPDTEPMGVAKSHGCIRMRNADVIELYERCSISTVVVIEE